jgi:hypothetical protein
MSSNPIPVRAPEPQPESANVPARQTPAPGQREKAWRQPIRIASSIPV